MKWKKMRLPIVLNDQTGADLYDGIIDGSINAKVLNCGGGYSESISKQYIVHWEILMIIGENMIEATYKQKVQILKELGIWKEVALEVMPRENDVVDRENLYHIWEFQYPYSFMHDIKPIYDEPQMYEGCWRDIDYHVFERFGITYIYFKSLKQITWRQKQNLKNSLMGEHIIAVEIIQEEMLNKGYSCMICFKEVLDFGLI